MSTDNYTAFQYIGFVKYTVSAETLQTSSQPHNLKAVLIVCWTRSEKQPEIYGPCASDLERSYKKLLYKTTYYGSQISYGWPQVILKLTIHLVEHKVR
jgi:hypothetical protein